jgi:hypothetical protein
MAQGAECQAQGPEFKPQFCQTNKSKKLGLPGQPEQVSPSSEKNSYI